VAKETITKLIDDLDGGQAHETVRFELDGSFYEIDLSTRNATKLRKELAPYVDNGSRVSGRGIAVRRRSVARPDREQNQAIREWALRKGLAVAPRGRIKQEVMEEYRRSAGR
jgi:hypothetical protein